MNKKLWNADAADTDLWEHGDYWPLVAPKEFNPEKELETVGFAIICPKEIIPGVLHRHHFHFKRGLPPVAQGWTYTDDNILINSPALDCESVFYKHQEYAFQVLEGEINDGR
jgi:hypothetical protein